MVAVDERAPRSRSKGGSTFRESATTRCTLWSRPKCARAACSSRSSWSPGMSSRSATCRSYDHNSTPSGSAEAKVKGAAALEAPDLDERTVRRVAREPVEQRRLVDLQRGDAVIELVRGEEEREILEPTHVRRPLLDAVKTHRGRIAHHGCVDEVLADRRPAEAADELLHAVRHAGERYCNART